MILLFGEPKRRNVVTVEVAYAMVGYCEKNYEPIRRIV